MKVVDLGNGAIAIKTSSPEDHVAALSKDQLKLSKVSDESIDIYLSYVRETSRDRP